MTSCPLIGDWNHQPDEILQMAKTLATRQIALNDALCSLKNPTIDEVLSLELKDSKETNLLSAKLNLYKNCFPDKAIRDAAVKASQVEDDLTENEMLREDVYKVWKRLQEDIALSGQKLDPETNRLVEKKVAYFEKFGIHLASEHKRHVEELLKDGRSLIAEYFKNYREDETSVLLSAQELKGLPQSTIDNLETSTEFPGKYVVSLKGDVLDLILKFAHDQETRRKVLLAEVNKCPQNVKLFEKLLKLRLETAKCLGLNTFADFMLKETMIKDRKNAWEFLKDLQTRFTQPAQTERKILIDLKNKDLKEGGHEQQCELYAWDVSYYTEKLRNENHLVDHQTVSEYFPFRETKAKVMRLLETLLDITIEKVKDLREGSLWHPDVELYQVYENSSDGEDKTTLMGYLFLDLHPREGKLSHPRADLLIPSYELEDSSRNLPSCIVFGGFEKPTEGCPSLLLHSQVATLLHELGHAMHNILSKTKYPRFSGVNVEKDFKEAPSQLLEYWVWSKEGLKFLSQHYKTGMTMGDDLMQQLSNSKHVASSLLLLRQLHFGLFDLTIYSISDKVELESTDFTDLWNNMREEVGLVSFGQEKTIGYATFFHIVAAYASSYYSYLYSEVFACDIYYTIFKSNPLSTEEGVKYRDTILSRGGSKDSMVNLVELLGRKPSSEAFFREKAFSLVNC